MYKKNSQDISEQGFQRHNELVCKNYQQPSPQYSAKPTKFDTLVYVATTFNQKPKTNFNHSESSPFRMFGPNKK
jgi:hypothetical protein